MALRLHVMVPAFLGTAALALLLLMIGATAVDQALPFDWSTAGTKLYSFCSNSSGALSPEAVKALSRSRVMIHGMEVGAQLDPVWENSEYKTSLAAKQLRAVAPDQLQLYTVQIDFARSVYASGEWFNSHHECVLHDKHGDPVLNNASKPTNFPGNVGHCNQNVSIPGKSYPYGKMHVHLVHCAISPGCTIKRSDLEGGLKGGLKGD